MTSEDRVRSQYVKYALLQRNLTKLLEAVSREVIQNDIEWMNLLAVANKSKEENSPVSSNNTRAFNDNKGSVEKVWQMDCGASNSGNFELPELNLNPNISASKTNVPSESEEFDSD